MIDFAGKPVTVLGRHGFIGSGLVAELEKRGAIVSSTPTKDSAAVFHFASYTHQPFEKNPAYHSTEVLNSYLYFFNFCSENNIPFIYPSSALIYEAPRPFYWFKKIVEEMQYMFKINSVALRIFPVYGSGEGERGHPTAIHQWVEQMVKGEQPIVYGDGTQSRDFIYIDDVVENIISLAENMDQPHETVKDIGSGKLLVFNDIIKAINEELGSNLEPVYHPVPTGYATGIRCQNPVVTKVDIHEGIRRMIREYAPTV